MAHIILSDTAKAVLQKLQGLTSAIIITLEDRSGLLIGRLVDGSTLEVLKTQWIGNALSNIPVYLFGIEEFAKDTVLDLTFIPARGLQPISDASEEVNLSYLLNVTVRNPNETAMLSRL